MAIRKDDPQNYGSGLGTTKMQADKAPLDTETTGKGADAGVAEAFQRAGVTSFADMFRALGDQGKDIVEGVQDFAKDFVPSVFDQNNKHRSLLLAGLQFMGPSNVLTGESAWREGVGALQGIADSQAKITAEGLERDSAEGIAGSNAAATVEAARVNSAGRQALGDQRAASILNAAEIGLIKSIITTQMTIDSRAAIEDASRIVENGGVAEGQILEYLNYMNSVADLLDSSPQATAHMKQLAALLRTTADHENQKFLDGAYVGGMYYPTEHVLSVLEQVTKDPFKKGEPPVGGGLDLDGYATIPTPGAVDPSAGD